MSLDRAGKLSIGKCYSPEKENGERVRVSERSYFTAKRAMDLILGGLLALVFFSACLLLALAIRLTSKGPSIFVHRRVGWKGKEFNLYKFRSMYLGAHEALHDSNPELLKQFKDSDWKLPNDQRVTLLGRFLRSCSMDECPQLFNVLRGDMSLVGPRPYMRQELEEQLKRFPQAASQITDALSVKPGITGLWQVSGRNHLGFEKRISLDAQYARERRLSKDLGILFRTPRAMFNRW